MEAVFYSCALLTALQKRGLDPCAFKCGPDYIDPMFHRSVLGVESHNLDLFLAEETAVRQNFRRWAAGEWPGSRGLFVVDPETRRGMPLDRRDHQ